MGRGPAVPHAPIDAGDVEVYHPACRTKIMITILEIRRMPTNRTFLFVEGICPRCDCYVRLALRESGL